MSTAEAKLRASQSYQARMIAEGRCRQCGSHDTNGTTICTTCAEKRRDYRKRAKDLPI
jgi:recombinational DNA repair protein RecR